MKKLVLLILVVAVTSAAQVPSTCPVEIVKLNPSHESSWNNVGTASKYGNNARHNKFLEAKVKNNSDKAIRGAKFVAAYYDATEDLTTLPVEWNMRRSIKPGEVGTENWDANAYQGEAAIGWVISPIKILFEDGTTWESKTNECSFEWWRDKKHPRVNKAPDLDKVKQE